MIAKIQILCILRPEERLEIMKQSLMFIFMLLTAFSLTSCNYRFEKTQNQSKDPLQEKPIGNPDVLTFAMLKEKIFLNNCTECHKPSKSKGGVDLTTYKKTMENVVAGNPEASRLYQVLLPGAENQMPEGGSLSPSEIDYVKQWILNGALETSNVTRAPEPTPIPNPAPIPTPNDPPGGEPPVVNPPKQPVPVNPFEVSYQMVFEQVFDNNCITCHNATKSKGGVDLSNYTKAIEKLIPGQPEKSLLYTTLFRDAENPMPPKKSLSAEQIQLIKDWILGGAKEKTEGEINAPPVAIELPVLPKEITFKMINEKILVKRCNACHDGAPGNYAPDFTSYKSLMDEEVIVPGNLEKSSFYTDIIPNLKGEIDMPEDGEPLSASEVQLIKDWILNGALENGVGDKP